MTKKAELEKTINGLHLDLEKNIFNSENQEKFLINELEILQRQVTMSENEKLDSVKMDKESLIRKNEELLAKRQELFNKWQSENQDFSDIFERLSIQKNEIKTQLNFLKTEKEMLKDEKNNLKDKEERLNEERNILENNKKTLMLFKNFQDTGLIKDQDNIKNIIKETASNLVNNVDENTEFEPKNEFSEYFIKIKDLHEKRRKELLKNSFSQIEIISKQISDEEFKKSKSSKNLAELKGFLRN